MVLPSGVRGTRRFFGLFPSISYVRESNRSNTWTIEPRDDLENSSHSHGHTRLPSSPSNEVVVTKKPRSRFLEALKAAIPTPWKRKPVTVQSIPARKGFRIDDIDRRTSTTPSRPSIAMTLDDEHAPGEHPWKYLPQPQASSNGSRSGAENLFPGDDPGDDSDDDGENTEHEEEHTSLLSASSRMGHNIMLISRNGEDFTLESGDSQQGSRQHHGPSLNIVPPSPAMARPDPSKQPMNVRFDVLLCRVYVLTDTSGLSYRRSLLTPPLSHLQHLAQSTEQPCLLCKKPPPCHPLLPFAPVLLITVLLRTI